jgi:glucose/arabinose dehydrogenase
MRNRLRWLMAGLAMVLAAGASLSAVVPAGASATTASDFSLTKVAQNIKQPHALRLAPDGRMFLLEQSGRVRIIKNGQLLTAPALTIDPSKLVPPGGSAGLLSIAFAPNFTTAATKYVYLVYTHTPMTGYNYPHNVVSRFVISGDTIDPASEQILVHLDTLVGKDGTVKTMHYGGDIEFGADGKLYVTTGDLLLGPNAQSLSNRYGKLLRYNADGSIPSDNPFYGTLTGDLRAIWAYGLRNPFKLTYDQPTGRFIIGDVGSASWEEVNVLEPGEAGVNFGWPNVEGYGTGDPRYKDPLVAYPHTADGTDLWGCAVMGGDTYRPTTATFPSSYVGKYFFADHCQGWLRTIDPKTGSLGPIIVQGLEGPVDMAVAPDGNLWLIQRDLDGVANGTLFRVAYVGAAQSAPVITTQPQDVGAAIGGSATFDVFASGSQPLTYQWRRNGVPITGATGATLTVDNLKLTDNGSRFSVVVTNSLGTKTSRDALLSVSSNLPPEPVITAPMVGATFAAGDTLTLTGSATDPEDGVLPASAFEWSIELHHNTHTHPEAGPFTGVKSMTYQTPTATETDPDIFFRVHLVVTDSLGQTAEVTRDVLPRTSTLSVLSLPTSGSVDIDGQPTPTPVSRLAVVGVQRTLTGSPITVAGTPMVLDSWMRGETNLTRSFRMPSYDKTYTAFFRVTAGTVGTGNGLSATYYSRPDFTSPVVTRTDRVPYFDWGSGRPATGVPANDFSARWRGQLLGQFTSGYTFAYEARAGEAMRLTVGGKVLIDTFATPTSGTVTASLALTAGKSYPIAIDYRESTGTAALQLTYAASGTPMSVIPGTQLTP